MGGPWLPPYMGKSVPLASHPRPPAPAAGLLRPGGAGLLDHLGPADDLGLDEAGELVRRRADDRDEAAPGKLRLHLRLADDRAQLGIELAQDRRRDAGRR